MKTIEFSAKRREANGKKEVNALRNEGLVPCVIYGNGENVHFAVSEKEIKALIYTPEAHIVLFDIEGNKETVVMREVQYHPVSDRINHIDFYRIGAGKPVSMEVPVVLTGVAEGVKQGGKLSLSKRKLTISATVDNLPDFIEVDVTNLTLGGSIFVGDIKPEGYSILTPASTAVCAVKMTRAARGAQATAEATPAKKK